MGNLFPQIRCLDALGDAIVAPLDQFPVAFIEDSLQEFVADAHRVV